MKYLLEKDDVIEIVGKTLSQILKDELPDLIRKANRKKWIMTSDVMEILQCTRRHVQHLRDSKRLPYRQNGRTIRYDIDEVENYLNRGKVNDKGSR